MDELLGLGYNHHAGEEDDRVESVTLAQVREVAARYFGMENSSPPPSRFPPNNRPAPLASER